MKIHKFKNNIKHYTQIYLNNLELQDIETNKNIDNIKKNSYNIAIFVSGTYSFKEINSKVLEIKNKFNGDI